MTSHFPTTVHDPQPVEPAASILSHVASIMRKCEPPLALFFAAATGWLSATTPASELDLWPFCLLSLGVSAWALLRRAAPRAEIAARAMTLLAAGYLLSTDAGVPADATGVLFSWLGVIAAYYLFILCGPYASLSRRSSRSSAAATDRSKALYNRGGLLAQGKDLLADCRAQGRELTLAVFDCTDLLEARLVYGDRISRKLVDSMVRKLQLLAGDGIAARTGPTQFVLAMPMSRDKAVQTIERLLGNPARFELEGSRNEIVLVPHLMVEAVPPAGTVERMFSALCRGLARVQEEERMRQQSLQRASERHSRPMPIRVEEKRAVRPARPQLLDPDPVAMAQQIPTTIPMPLGSR